MIASLLISCTSSIKNPGLVFKEGDSVPKNWKLELNEGFSIEKSLDGSNFKTLITSDSPGQLVFSQNITLDSGDYFLMAKFNANVKQGSFFIKAGNIKSISVNSTENTCLRTVFAIPIEKKESISIQLGFSPESIGQALIDTIMIHKMEYKFYEANFAEARQKTLNEKLNLTIKADSSLDTNINRIANGVNMAFLAKKDSFGQDLLSTFSSNDFDTKSTSYLSQFMRNSSDLSAYCQKSSLSMDEILRLYNIPTRQLHWQKNCSGIHQFLEYYNAYDHKWKVIDPYYGIRYINNKGEYMGFEEIESLIRKDEFTKDNIEQLSIRKLYYREQEVLDGWFDTDLAVYIINK